MPYELHANGRVDIAAGKYWVDFINSGRTGAGFNVYSANRNDGPWFYTIESGKRLSDYWSAVAVTSGKYDLRVFGPNGFLREFKGDLALAGTGRAQPELESIYDPANGRIVLRLRNTGNAACTLTVRPNRYSSAAARTYTIAPGATVDDAWSISGSGHWYDLSVTSNTDAGYLRRLAGHVENGFASISDPAIGA